jgi:hypothetical protein
MATNKLTKTELFNRLSTIVSSAPIEDTEKDRLTNFIAHELGLIAKKRASKTETPQERNNTTTMELILDALADKTSGMTITELTKVPNIAAIEGNSTHRISALVTKLKNAGKVTRVEVKGVAFFFLAKEEEDTEKDGE